MDITHSVNIQLGALSSHDTMFRKFAFYSVPLAGCAAFFVFWAILTLSSIAFCLTAFRNVIYFVGMSFYVCAMVDDLAVDLDSLDTISSDPLVDRAAGRKIQRELAKKVRFHNEIIEYAMSFFFFHIFYFGSLLTCPMSLRPFLLASSNFRLLFTVLLALSTD